MGKEVGWLVSCVDLIGWMDWIGWGMDGLDWIGLGGGCFIGSVQLGWVGFSPCIYV